MPETASRIAAVKPSATIAVKQEADRLKAEGVDVIDFGPGEPDFNAPETVKQAAHKAIDSNLSHYLPTKGLPELRTGVADKYRKLYGADYTADEVLIACGGKSALFAATMALFEPGDEVIIPSPFWVSFPEQLTLAGARAVIQQTRDEGFVARASSSARLITDSTKGIILCSPSNPTGVIIPEDELAAYADLALKHDLFLVFDECYEHFLYDGSSHASLAAQFSRIRDRLVVVSTFSKSYAMTGYRVGYAISDLKIIKAMATVQGHDATHATSITQAAAYEALTGSQESLHEMVKEYGRRRELIVEGLRSIPGVTCTSPDGAFYAFPCVEGLYEKLGVNDSIGLTKKLLQEARIAVVPGEAFGCPGYVRFSYALAADLIQEGIDRFRKLATG